MFTNRRCSCIIASDTILEWTASLKHIIHTLSGQPISLITVTWKRQAFVRVHRLNLKQNIQVYIFRWKYSNKCISMKMLKYLCEKYLRASLTRQKFSSISRRFSYNIAQCKSVKQILEYLHEKYLRASLLKAAATSPCLSSTIVLNTTSLKQTKNIWQNFQFVD